MDRGAIYPLPFPRTLFVAEGLDRVQPGCLPRRIEAEDNSNPGGHQHRDDDRRHRGLRRPVLDPADQQRGAAAHHDADPAADKAQEHRLHEELPQDVMAAHPTAMRRPISRVRSVTETSMIFMIPTPPTTSEIAATTSNNAPINSEVEAMVLVISVMSRVSKSLSRSGGRWCRSRNSPLVSLIASGISSGLAALTRIRIDVNQAATGWGVSATSQSRRGIG